MPDRKDPYLAFRFRVEIKGLIEAGFSECSGLQAETEVEEYREGGVNIFVHKLPARTKYQTLTLKRGLTNSTELWYWYQTVVAGIVIRLNGSIWLSNSEGREQWRWNFIDAYPIKWIGPTLRADQGSVAIETLELVHHGLFKG